MCWTISAKPAKSLSSGTIRTRLATLGTGAPAHVTLENLFERLGTRQVQTLNIILRADVRGSIEAMLKEFGKLEHPEVKVKVLQATVGGISEADVHLADASDAVIIGFNVVPDEKARVLAERKGVQIRRYDIIYQVTDDLKKALEGMLKPEKREAELGRALILRIFSISRVGTIAGCRVLSGTMQRNSRVRIIRDNRVLGDYPMETLRREKDDVREVREGLECGIKARRLQRSERGRRAGMLPSGGSCQDVLSSNVMAVSDFSRRFRRSNHELRARVRYRFSPFLPANDLAVSRRHVCSPFIKSRRSDSRSGQHGHCGRAAQIRACAT